MSQITRCPSCGTTFKVVADQLRISDGWVRCGQCKDVFDAAAHLVVIETAPLLPEMRFDGQRSEPGAAIAALPSPAVQVWGSARTLPSSPQTSSRYAAFPSPTGHPGEEGVQRGGASVGAAMLTGTVPGATGASVQARPPDLSAPGVPHFLATVASANAASEQAGAPAWSLEPQSPYGWTTRTPAVPLPPHSDASPELSHLPSYASAASSGAATGAAASVAPEPVGYELPFAQLRDSGWPEDLEREAPAQAPEVERPLPVLSDGLVSEGQEREPTAFQGLLIAPSADVPQVADEAIARSGADTPADAPTAFQRHNVAMASQATGAIETRPPQDEDEDLGKRVGVDEPGFVKAARRQAFWSRPATRAMLAGFAMLFAALLLAQVAVRERDTLAARYPGLRGALVALCMPWRCSLAPPRRITDVVIDSSSFTRGRQDTYLLSMTIKNNNADTAVAMPAVELTLTDAQDQPLLRKVLQAGEIAAPHELPARGEWSGALSLNVAELGSRVAGYRLLAFYP